MNINEILTEIEYTKKRSAKEFFEFFTQKQQELSVWSQEHSGTKPLRETKYRELSKGLPDKFAHELTPFAYYVNTYYSNNTSVRFKPCCGSEKYDGNIIDNGKEVFVEFTNAIEKTWGLQKELLIEKGHSPWGHSILGVNGNKSKLKRSVSDIITSDECVLGSDVEFKTKELIKKTVSKKCVKSTEQKLPYGQNKTILIVTFDDTGLNDKYWDNFVNFKRTELDSMKHNFSKIILFGWCCKKFID